MHMIRLGKDAMRRLPLLITFSIAMFLAPSGLLAATYHVARTDSASGYPCVVPGVFCVSGGPRFCAPSPTWPPGTSSGRAPPGPASGPSPCLPGRGAGPVAAARAGQWRAAAASAHRRRIARQASAATGRGVTAASPSAAGPHPDHPGAAGQPRHLDQVRRPAVERRRAGPRARGAR